MPNPPRRIFQLDGIYGGVLNIAERPYEDFVLLITSTDKGEAKIALGKDDFVRLAELRYILRFADAEPQADTPALETIE